MAAHPGLAAQAAEDGGVNGGHAAIYIGIIHARDGVAVCARHEVVLDQPDVAQVLHVSVLCWLQRHVLGTHLQNCMRQSAR